MRSIPNTVGWLLVFAFLFFLAILYPSPTKIIVADVARATDPPTPTPTETYTPDVPTETYTPDVPPATSTPVPPTATATPGVGCVAVGVISVCADDLTFNGSSYTGSVNVRFGNYISVTGGNITATPSSGLITGTGTINFVPTVGSAVAVRSGTFSFNSSVTSSGILPMTGGTLLLNKISGLNLSVTTPPTVALNTAGSLNLSGGQLQLIAPYAQTLNLVSYTHNFLGEISGSVDGFILTPGPTTILTINQTTFTPTHLDVSGTIIVNHFTNQTATFNGMSITSDTITTSPISGSGVDFGILGEIAFGPARISLGNGIYEVSNTRNQGTELSFIIEDVSLALSDRLFNTGQEFVMDIDKIRIYHDDVRLEGTSQLALPDITIKGFKLTGLKVGVERRDAGGYAFNGEGALEVKNFIKRSSSDEVGIFVGVKVYMTNTELTWENLQAGLRGVSIPLGTTPVFLTSLDGSVDLSGVDAQLAAMAGVELGPPELNDLLGGAILSGDTSLTVNTGGWGELSGNLKLFEEFDAANASLSVNKPGVSVDGVRGTFNVNALNVILGNFTAYLGFDDPAIEGSALVTLQLPVSQASEWIQFFIGDEDITLTAVQAFLTKLSGKYGIGANAQLGDLQFAVFINSSGEIDVDDDWFPVSSNPRAAHVIATQRDELRAGQMGLTLTGVSDAVVFVLDPNGATHLKLTLTDPAGNEITAGNVTNYPNITLGRQLGGWAYLVKNPAAGNWTMKVKGIIGGENYTLDALTHDTQPTVNINSVAAIGNGYTIAWDGADSENTALVSLYYDVDAQGYDGVLIASGQPLDGQYAWALSAVPNGTYYVYAKVEDGSNIPAVSAYSGVPVSVMDLVAPSVPMGLSALAGQDKVKVSWLPNTEPDLDGYTVSYTYSSNPLNVFTQTVSGQQAILPRPDLVQSISVQVAAVDVSGNQSAFSAALTILPSQLDDLTPPADPTNLTGVAVGTDVALSWTPVFDATSYRVYYDYDQPGAFRSGTVDVTGSAATIPALKTERDIYLTLTALDANGNESGFSNVVMVRISTGEFILANGGFETGPKVPTGWTAAGLSKDKRKCNNDLVIVSKEGVCAFMFKGSALEASNLIQTIKGNRTGNLWLRGWVKANKATKGGLFFIKVIYQNDTRERFKLPIATGTYDYQFIDQVLVLDAPVKKVVFQVRNRMRSGKFFVDDLSLYMVSASTRDWLPLPPQN